MKYSDLTDGILKSFYKVYTLGYGFLEKVYENALFIELCSAGFIVEKQSEIAVFYAGKRIGEYYADLIVNDTVIVEIKASET